MSRKTVVRSTSPQRSSTGFVAFLRSSPRINWGQILLGMIVGLIAVTLASVGYKQLRDEQATGLRSQTAVVTAQAHADQIASLRAAYDADLRLWDKKVADFNTCIVAAQTRVDARLAFRSYETAKAHGFHDLILTFFPTSDVAHAVADQNLADSLKQLDDNEAPLDLTVEQKKCTPAGPEPIKPKELG